MAVENHPWTAVGLDESQLHQEGIVTVESALEHAYEVADKEDAIRKMVEAYRKLNNQYEQKRYDAFVLLATSAPVYDGLPVEDDLNFIDTPRDEMIATATSAPVYDDLPVEDDLNFVDTLRDVMNTNTRLEHALALAEQEVKDLKAELADVKKIKTTATVSTSPTRPSTPHFASPNLSAFEAELHRSCNAHPRFVTWLSELDKAKDWKMTNVKAETSSRQVASSPHCTPTSCAVKGVSTASDLSPDTEAMLDHLLSPTNLPPSPCSPTPPAVLTSTAHGLSPETEAVLDYLLSPTNLPRTPYSAMAPAVITSPGHMTPTARPLNQGRRKAHVGMASAGARRTPLGGLTNLCSPQVASKTQGATATTPSFASALSPLQKRLDPLLKRSTPARLSACAAKTSLAVPSALKATTLADSSPLTAKVTHLYPLPHLSPLLVKPCSSSSPSCGGGGSGAAVNSGSPGTPPAFEFASPVTALVQRSIPGSLPAQSDMLLRPSPTAAASAFQSAQAEVSAWCPSQPSGLPHEELSTAAAPSVPSAGRGGSSDASDYMSNSSRRQTTPSPTTRQAPQIVTASSLLGSAGVTSTATDTTPGLEALLTLLLTPPVTSPMTGTLPGLSSGSIAPLLWDPTWPSPQGMPANAHEAMSPDSKLLDDWLIDPESSPTPSLAESSTSTTPSLAESSTSTTPTLAEIDALSIGVVCSTPGHPLTSSTASQLDSPDSASLVSFGQLDIQGLLRDEDGSVFDDDVIIDSPLPGTAGWWNMLVAASPSCSSSASSSPASSTADSISNDSWSSGNNRRFSRGSMRSFVPSRASLNGPECLEDWFTHPENIPAHSPTPIQAMSLESKLLNNWLVDLESSTTPIQAETDALSMRVPCSQLLTPAHSLCLSPPVKPISQGRRKAHVGMTSAGARRTPLGGLTNLCSLQVASKTQGVTATTPSFASALSPLQKQLDPLLKTSTPARLSACAAKTSLAVPSALKATTLADSSPLTAKVTHLYPLPHLSPLLVKPCSSSSPSCGGGGSGAAVNSGSPGSSLAFDFASPPTALIQRSIPGSLPAQREVMRCPSPTAAASAFQPAAPSVPSAGRGGSFDVGDSMSNRHLSDQTTPSIATRQTSQTTCPASRPAWSIAAPNSPAVSIISPAVSIRAPVSAAAGSSSTATTGAVPELTGVTTRARAIATASNASVVRPARHRDTAVDCPYIVTSGVAGSGVNTRARASARAVAAPNTTSAVRPARHRDTAVACPSAARSGAAGRAIAPCINVEDISNVAKQGSATQAHQSASNGSVRCAASRHPTTAAKKNAVAGGVNSGRQASATHDTAAASSPGDACMTRAVGRSRGRQGLKAEVPTRVQPGRGAKKAWRH